MGERGKQVGAREIADGPVLYRTVVILHRNSTVLYEAALQSRLKCTLTRRSWDGCVQLLKATNEFAGE